VGVEPVDERILAVRDREGLDARRRRVDLTTQRIECDELLRRQRPFGEVHHRREQRVARLLQCVDRTRRRRRGIVELVGETGGERAERAQPVLGVHTARTLALHVGPLLRLAHLQVGRVAPGAHRDADCPNGAEGGQVGYHADRVELRGVAEPEQDERDVHGTQTGDGPSQRARRCDRVGEEQDHER
jgi:hypothetical protein